ncbi:MAG: hypothetical protein AB1458_12060 [Bacteroidota bacterium]
MNKRVHIHQERITIEGETRRFLIHLPDDAGRIVSLAATASPEKVFEAGPGPGGVIPPGHYQVGRLRIEREGVLLCEMDVRCEDALAKLPDILPPGTVDKKLAAFETGKKPGPQIINASAKTWLLLCKFQGNALIKDYTLSVYVTYRHED